MLNEYADIRSRLGEPLWFDEYGVPRYDAFSPRLCGVYARYVALIEIACQACDQHFLVGVETSTYTELEREIVFPSVEHLGSFAFGDPPRHACVGDTMSSLDVGVLQFWRRDNPRHEWERDPTLEGLTYLRPDDPGPRSA